MRHCRRCGGQAWESHRFALRLQGLQRLWPIAGLAINVLLGLFVLLIIVPSLLHELR